MSKKKKKKSYKLNKKQLISVISCLVVFGLMLLLVVTNNIKWFDDAVYSVISKLISDPMTKVFESITFFSSVIFTIGVIIALFIFDKDKKHAFILTLNIGLCLLLNQALKFIICRPRPLDIGIIDESGYSFPSGHSMMAVAMYGMLIYFVLKKDMKKSFKIILTTLLCLLILLIGISRIYLGVHYASDVVGAFAVASAYLLIYINLLYKRFE